MYSIPKQSPELGGGWKQNNFGVEHSYKVLLVLTLLTRLIVTKFSIQPSCTSNISSMLASICYTVTYTGWLARAGINIVQYTNANILSLMACK